MRTLAWWSGRTIVGAGLGAGVMGLVCPLAALAIDTFANVTKGKPPPTDWDWVGPVIIGVLTGAVIGAYLGARSATRHALRQGGVASVPELVNCLLESESEELRLAAMEMLAELGPAARGAMAALRIAQNDPNETVREAATQTLARISKFSGADAP